MALTQTTVPVDPVTGKLDIPAPLVEYMISVLADVLSKQRHTKESWNATPKSDLYGEPFAIEASPALGRPIIRKGARA